MSKHDWYTVGLYACLRATCSGDYPDHRPPQHQPGPAWAGSGARAWQAGTQGLGTGLLPQARARAVQAITCGGTVARARAWQAVAGLHAGEGGPGLRKGHSHGSRCPLFSSVIKSVWLVDVCLCPALTYMFCRRTSLSHFSLVTEFMDLNRLRLAVH